MATVRQFQLLAGRALVDNDFRARLQKNPKTAARELKIRLTNADVELLSTANFSGLDSAAKSVQQNLPVIRAAWAGLKAEQLKRQAASFRPAQAAAGAGRTPGRGTAKASGGARTATRSASASKPAAKAPAKPAAKSASKPAAKSASKPASRGSTRRKG